MPFFEMRWCLPPGCWDLGDPCDDAGYEVDPWLFTSGTVVPVDRPLLVPVDAEGDPLDVSISTLGTVVIAPRIARVITDITPDDAQLIPVSIAGVEPGYRILNVTRVIDCIDAERCKQVTYFDPNQRPDRAGDLSSVIGLRIDTTRVGDARLFLTRRWTAIIVHETLKNRLEQIGCSGAEFRAV